SAQPSVLSREPWPLAKLREWLTLRQKFNINLFAYTAVCITIRYTGFFSLFPLSSFLLPAPCSLLPAP
ncbi:MAG: hypothetical protein F6K50_51195, partial [Moorea sp. SIO3I7]|nr:hypothetical protein [Moorena sp. SIO3I7]